MLWSRFVAVALCFCAANALAAQPTFTNITPPSGSPSARRSCGGALQQLSGRDRIWNFGGYRLGGALNDLYYYDTFTKGFVAVAQTTAPSARDRHVVGFDQTNTRLVVFGGTQSALSNPPVYGDLHVFNPATGAWSSRR